MCIFVYNVRKIFSRSRMTLTYKKMYQFLPFSSRIARKTSPPRSRIPHLCVPRKVFKTSPTCASLLVCLRWMCVCVRAWSRERGLRDIAERGGSYLSHRYLRSFFYILGSLTLPISLLGDGFFFFFFSNSRCIKYHFCFWFTLLHDWTGFTSDREDMWMINIRFLSLLNFSMWGHSHDQQPGVLYYWLYWFVTNSKRLTQAPQWGGRNPFGTISSIWFPEANIP